MSVYDNFFFRGGKRFDSASELMDLAMDTNSAMHVPLYARDYTSGGDEVYIENYDGIMNLQTHKVCAIASPQYQILQHQDCIFDLASGIVRSGHDIGGSLFDNGDSFVARFVLKDVENIPDDKSGICIGCEVRNSYDKTSSFKGGAFLVRQVCSNGMVIKNLLGDVNFSIYHTKKAPQKAPQAISTYIDNIVSSVNQHLGVVIEKAIDSEIVFDSTEHFQESLGELLGVAVHAKNIVDFHWDGRLDTNRWDLYNRVTEYISHTELSDPVRDRLLIKSEIILDDSESLLCIA